MRILLLREPLDNEHRSNQFLLDGSRLGREIGQEHVGSHLYLSRGSLRLVPKTLWHHGFLRYDPVDGNVWR